MANPIFRNDINLSNTWVTSDSHFGHDNIVGFAHRPLDHDQVMIAEWRKVVPEDATVIHLGDLCFKGNARFKHVIAPELTGKRKLLINNGNHDGQRYSFYRDCGFKLSRPFSLLVTSWRGSLVVVTRDHPEFADLSDVAYSLLERSAWRISFSHYAWAEEDGEQTPLDWRLHGHIHNNGYTRQAFVPFLRNHINLSVEQTRYTPVNLKLLLEAVLLGQYPQTTEEQLAEAAMRKRANLKAKGGR